MNKVILVGRLTKDLEVKHTQSGTAIGNFSIAVQRDFKNEDGTYDADFINCICFNKTAEKLAVYMTKGSKILVEGKIQVRNYDAADGTKKYVTEVVTDKIEFLGSKPKEIIEKSEASDPYKDMGDSIELSEEDLPF